MAQNENADATNVGVTKPLHALGKPRDFVCNVTADEGPPQVLVTTNDARSQGVQVVHSVQDVHAVHDESTVNVNSELDRNGLFTIMGMNAWLKLAASKPVPRRLFGDFWAEGELAILFADTGVGKSALATQIANSICIGQPISPDYPMDATPQTILYFDCELTDMQLQKRYAIERRNGDGLAYAEHYAFSDLFQRVEINWASRLIDAVNDWEPVIIAAIERAIVASGAKVVVVDNLSYLTSEADKGKSALSLMQRLNDLKKRHGLSLLVLAHTPKLYGVQPITIDNLAGSKILSNLADSIFCIGRSRQDANLRYLKQLKARSTELVHDADNVAVFRFEKEHNYLGFEYVGTGREWDEIAPPDKDSRRLMVEYTKTLSAQGKSQREVAHELGISLGAVNKYLHEDD